jgi:hypothetical protein
MTLIALVFEAPSPAPQHTSDAPWQQPPATAPSAMSMSDDDALTGCRWCTLLLLVRRLFCFLYTASSSRHAVLPMGRRLRPRPHLTYTLKTRARRAPRQGTAGSSCTRTGMHTAACGVLCSLALWCAAHENCVQGSKRISNGTMSDPVPGRSGPEPERQRKEM